MDNIEEGMKRTHRVSGRAVILRDEQLLLMSYKDGEYYNFPGGAVEPGETLAECARREVMEETGLTVDVGEALFTLEIEPRRSGVSGEPHISVFFACTVWNPPHRSSRRILTTAWTATPGWRRADGCHWIACGS